jgi:hypothetical protein
MINPQFIKLLDYIRSGTFQTIPSEDRELNTFFHKENSTPLIQNAN